MADVQTMLRLKQKQVEALQAKAALSARPAQQQGSIVGKVLSAGAEGFK